MLYIVDKKIIINTIKYLTHLRIKKMYLLKLGGGGVGGHLPLDLLKNSQAEVLVLKCSKSPHLTQMTIYFFFLLYIY